MSDNKKYYWIKLKMDFFNQDTIDFLLSQKNGCQYVVLYQMLCLMTANNNGYMATKFNEAMIPYDVPKIVRDTKYFDEDTVVVALELYKRLGLIYSADDTNTLLKLTNIETMVGSESANKEAVKKREYRAKLKAKEAENNMVRTQLGTNCPTEIDIDIEKDIDIYKKKNIYKKKKQEKANPNLEEIENYVNEKKLSVSAKDFYDYFTEGNWIDSQGKPVINWKQKILTWQKYKQKQPNNTKQTNYNNYDQRKYDNIDSLYANNK